MSRTTLMDTRYSNNEIKFTRCNPKLAYLVIEPEDGVNESLCPIIFLHGYMESKEIWRDIAQDVCNVTKRKAYVYDASNHGDSDWVDEFGEQRFVDDLNNFIDSENIPKAILIGYSMGGYAASRLALIRPDKVDKLVVEEVLFEKYPIKIVKSVAKLMILWADAVSQTPADLSGKDAVKFAVDYMYDRIPEDKQKQMSAREKLYDCNYSFNLNDGRYEVKVNIPACQKMVENWETLTSNADGIFEGPSCFIYGGSSILNVKNDDEILPHYPNSELHIIDNATHSVHIDQREKYLETILKFLLRK